MNLDLATMLYSLPAVVLGLTVHEFTHAFAASRLGDPTAADQGRLSLNPIRHLDPIGFMFIVVAGFGWAKPVAFDKTYLKSPRRDEALIALAGPLSNLALGILAALVLKLVSAVLPHAATGAYPVMVNTLLYLVFINFGLFIFNMIPIPPLDGSHVLFYWLRIDQALEARFYKLGMPLLFGVLILERATKIDILPIGKAVRWMAVAVFKILGM